MIDLALNSDFSVHLDDTNDLATVEGQEAFEQATAVALTDLMHGSLSGMMGSESTIKEKIRLEVSRVARSLDFIDSIARIFITPKENEPGTYTVEVDYVASGEWEFDVTT